MADQKSISTSPTEEKQFVGSGSSQKSQSPIVRTRSISIHSRFSAPAITPTKASRRISLVQGFRDLGRSVSFRLNPSQRRISRSNRGEHASPLPSPSSSSSHVGASGGDWGYWSKGNSSENISAQAGDGVTGSGPILPPTPERSILKSSPNSRSRLDSLLLKEMGAGVVMAPTEAEVISNHGGVEWFQRGFGPEVRCNSISDYLDFVSLETAASPSSDDVQWVNSPMRRVSSYERFKRACRESNGDKYPQGDSGASDTLSGGSRSRWMSIKRALLKKK